MAGIPAIGTGPVAITTSDGRHLTIPLSVLTFDKGAITVSGWPPYSDAAIKLRADHWLAHLVAQNELKPSTVPLAPAFSLEATNPGALGNAITVKITKVTPADPRANTKIDAEVSVANTYTGLTLATLAGTLGTGPGGGSQPGLVYVKSIAASPKMPVDLPATDLGNPPKLDVKDGASAITFTLAAPGDGGSPDEFKAAIVVTAADTFTLTVTWKKKATVMLSGFDAQFVYVVTCKPPSGGFASNPTVGDITLSGGADPVTFAPVKAIKAKAVVASA